MTTASSSSPRRRRPAWRCPTEAKLAAVIEGGCRQDDLTAYVDTVGAARAARCRCRRRARSCKTTTNDALGITEWELSNGVKVVLKPTTFKEDEILFRAISPGGTSLASDADYIPASTATQVVTAGGLGKFSADRSAQGADRQGGVGDARSSASSTKG